MDHKIFNNRGIAYYKLGQYEMAIQDYDDAIRIDPQNAGTYYNRGFTYYDLGQYERAIQDFGGVSSIVAMGKIGEFDVLTMEERRTIMPRPKSGTVSMAIIVLTALTSGQVPTTTWQY